MADPDKDKANPEEEGEAQSKGLKGLFGNPWVLFGIGLVVAVALSVGATLVLMGDPSTGDPAAAEQPLARQQAEIIEKQNARLQALEKELAAIRARMESMQDETSLALTKEVLLGQEEGFVTFIEALKEGMADIAHMVRGSRDWLELYQQKLDAVIAQSEARQRQIKSWPDPPPEGQR